VGGDVAGLSRLHGSKIENYTTADGLSSNVITALLSRSNGTLLIGAQTTAGTSGMEGDSSR